MSTKDFLLEIGTEELPAKALGGLIEALSSGITQGLEKQNIAFGEIELFSAPRRLAVYIHDVAVEQASKLVERRGPALQAAYDANGNATPATLGFARSCGVAIEQLEKLETDKGSWLIYKQQQAATATEQLLPSIIQASVTALPIPKPMRWANHDYAFLRPVHWLMVLFGDAIVPMELLGCDSDRISYGHRFHSPGSIRIGVPKEYQSKLRDIGMVLASVEERKTIIVQQTKDRAHEVGGKAVIDDELLNEVVNLVEWPVAMRGTFEERFLAVPQECLISTMADNQRYFHVVDGKGKLMPYFITIANIESEYPVAVIQGNEKVIRPRFSDAEFFFNADKKMRLCDRRAGLSNVVFQQKLGTLAEKATRVAELAGQIAGVIGADENKAYRAAELCKADLLSAMVNEFPELQGVMGEYYALNDGEDTEVAQAIREHYLPRFSGDAMPQTKTGIAVALADRLDTLVGIFGVGQAPTGAKDPFALRRAAIGLLRLCVENELALDLKEAITWSVRILGERVSNPNTLAEVQEFVLARFKGQYQDEGVASEVLTSVAVLEPTNPFDFDRRVRAVKHFVGLPESAALAAANKRVRNILAKSDVDLSAVTVTEGALIEKAEQDLWRALSVARKETLPLMLSGDYTAVLVRLASLRTAIDAFFDHVMVNTPHEEIRKNRLALLHSLQQMFSAVADISQLPG